MWENMVEPGRPQIRIWRIYTACWIPKATNTLRICITYSFSTTTVVSRTLLTVTLHVQCCLVCDVKVLYAVCFRGLTDIRICVHGSSVLLGKLD